MVQTFTVANQGRNALILNKAHHPSTQHPGLSHCISVTLGPQYNASSSVEVPLPAVGSSVETSSSHPLILNISGRILDKSPLILNVGRRFLSRSPSPQRWQEVSQ